MEIHAAIGRIIGEIGGIEKGRRNEKQGYKFRGIDDVYFAAQPLLAKHGVYTLPRVTASSSDLKETKNGYMWYRILTVEYDFISTKDGSKVTAIVQGEGMDPGDKATNKAMSAAHKYAFLQVFAIPTEEHKDSEYDSPEMKSAVVPKQIIDNMLASFLAVGVTPMEIEDKIRKPINEITHKDLVVLRELRNSLKGK